MNCCGFALFCPTCSMMTQVRHSCLDSIRANSAATNEMFGAHIMRCFASNFSWCVSMRVLVIPPHTLVFCEEFGYKLMTKCCKLQSYLYMMCYDIHSRWNLVRRFFWHARRSIPVQTFFNTIVLQIRQIQIHLDRTLSNPPKIPQKIHRNNT